VNVVSPNDPDKMKTALTVGPITVAISADANYLSYKGGIIKEKDCGDKTNRFALSVGWGTDDTEGDFYIVKESFGTTWGESGYARISITEGKGTCGINTLGSYPTSN